MSWLMATLYDRFLEPSERECARQWRRELLADLSGEVLEVGAGTGLNLAHYPAAVTKLTLTEPDAHMRQALMERLASSAPPCPVQTLDSPIEALPLAEASVDAVVCTLVLCSVKDQDAALRELRRVLRPAGRLIYLEHVLCEDRPGRRAMQRLVEPGWRLVAGNCHLTRQTQAAIVRAGFELERCDQDSMRKALPFLRPTIRGVARKTP